MSAVENIRAALADATNGPWIGAGPSFGAPHPAYLDSVVEDVDNDCAATICRDTETGDARYIAACNPAAMAEVLAHIDRQAAEIAGLEADAAEHLAELRAYELTVANLREQLALPETVEVLLCDFCGCETPDPWHGSTETDHHIHACDACKPKLWASQAPQAQRGEPVAWKWRFADGDLSESPFESRSECERDAVGYDGEAIPLYTHPQAPQVPMTLDSVVDLVGECGLDWHKGFEPLFDGDPTNRFAVLVEAVEAHHGIKEQP